MAKKVKFPLDMGNEVYVRTLEELKENYNSEKVTEYFLEGRLLTWLNDRYYEEEAAAVGELAESGDKENLAAKLGKIFGIEIQDDVDVENLEIRREKIDKLRQITADDEILDNVDSVAFSQEELGDLLDNEAEVIYLCGEKFRIPLGVKNVKYIGVNKPVISIGGKEEIDLEASGIVFVKCEFSDDTKARFAVKKENKDIVEQKDIERKDIVINKDPLHLKKGEAASHIINCFVDLHLDNPKPCRGWDITFFYHNRIPSLIGERIVLSARYHNFTFPKEDKKFAKVIPAQSKYAAEAIKKHEHILCCTDDNKEAFASGCLFENHLSNYVSSSISLTGQYSLSCLQIYIKPEKYTEFLEKFAVTSLIAVPCRENVSIIALERIIYDNKSALNYIIPLIYIDMSKVVDDMCKKLGKTVSTLEKGNFFFDIGDYSVYNNSYSHYLKDLSRHSYPNSYGFKKTAEEFERTDNYRSFNDYANAIKKWLN